MNGQIEIKEVALGRGGLGARVKKPCVQNAEGKWLTVKCIVKIIEGGLSEEETVEEFGVGLADVLACLAYAKQYPQILD